MNLVDKIKELKKKKATLQKKHDRLLPKYTALEKEYLQTSAELGEVISTLNKITTVVAKTLKMDESEIKKECSVARDKTIKEEIVEYLVDNPHSTANKIGKELEYDNAANYLSMLALKDDPQIKRTRTNEQSPWLYFTESFSNDKVKCG